MSWFDPEVAWAAGFFEGEGSITTSNGRLIVRIHNTDLEPLEGFARIVVFGEIYGPYGGYDRDGHSGSLTGPGSRKSTTLSKSSN